MSYDQDTRTFTFYSEDWGLIGDHAFTVKAYFDHYQHASHYDRPAQAILEVFEPCKLYKTDQMSLEPYDYTGEILEFIMNPPEVVPNICPVTYGCYINTYPKNASLEKMFCNHVSSNALTKTSFND